MSNIDNTIQNTPNQDGSTESWETVQTRKKKSKPSTPEQTVPTNESSKSTASVQYAQDHKKTIEPHSDYQSKPNSSSTSSSSLQPSVNKFNSRNFHHSPLSSLFVQNAKKRDTHMLPHTFTFSFFQPDKNVPKEDYQSQIKAIGDFNTVEGFWAFYSHLLRPSELPPFVDLHLFRKGVRPMWEDEMNKEGGRWIIRIKEEFGNRLWEELLLGFIGQQFSEASGEICGLVLSRRDFIMLSIWTKHADNEVSKSKIRETMKYVMRLPSNVSMEYKPHNMTKYSMHRTLYPRPRKDIEKLKSKVPHSDELKNTERSLESNTSGVNTSENENLK